MVRQSPIVQLHVFEAAGLGKAPFRYIGSQVGPMNCNYCSTPIVNQFHVESADGKRFIVGCECIKKTDDTVLIQRVSRAMRELSRIRKADRFRSLVEIARRECETLIVRHAGRLDSIPENVPASVGPPTLLSWSRWMLDRGSPPALLERLRVVLDLPR